MLTPFAESLWTAATPIRFAGSWFPHVMTVIRLSDRNVLLHSPCRPASALYNAIAGIGAVTHVVAPNWFHDLYLREYRASYPNARFWGPRFLQRQHPRLIDDVLNAGPAAPWAGDLSCTSLSGLLSFDEAVFFHIATRTLIVADLLINASADEKAPPLTRLGYKLFGLDGRLQIFPILRWFGFRSRSSMRHVAAQILAWKPDRVIVGHGDPIVCGAGDELHAALGRWHAPA